MSLTLTHLLEHAAGRTDLWVASVVLAVGVVLGSLVMALLAFQDQRPVMAFQRLTKDAHAPRYAHPGDAGMDLRSPKAYAIKAHGHLKIPIELAFRPPPGTYLSVEGRSSMNNKNTSTHGVIDNGYRGFIYVVICNHNDKMITIEAGAKIAQLICKPFVRVAIREDPHVTKDKTSRGNGGFGSTER